jgi:Predicted membrane protein (DUF2142)
MTQPEVNERKWVLLLCCAAAVHVFIFSAAFPFFNNVDEQKHFDLVVKYSHGDIPRSLKTVSSESSRYIVLYGSLEYLGNPTNFPDGKFPPPPWTWPQTDEKIRKAILAKEVMWQDGINHECSQPPLYYALAGLDWRVGEWIGFHGGHLLYWLRFLNIFAISALVWLDYIAARMVFPEQCLPRLAVPALLAFFPQSTFYSVSNDVLLSLCSGAAFICLIHWWRDEIPNLRLGILLGLALAATGLTKMSSLPLLALSAVVVLLKILQLAKTGKWRAALPSLLGLTLCAVLPLGFWLAWCKHNFGDFTGSAPKIQSLGWTLKPFSEWWHHPIFTPHGLWTFLSKLIATFWQGEFWWHRQPMALPMANFIYVASTLFLLGVAVAVLCRRFVAANRPPQDALWLALGSLVVSVVFLGFLSIIYDFHDCFYPSREFPYFASGRLMLGALIPFILLFVFGLDCILSRVRNLWVKPLIIMGIILFMLVTEIITNWPAFSNAYNWFHLS